MELGFLSCRGLSPQKLKLHCKLVEDSGGYSICFDEDYLCEDTFSRAGFAASITSRVLLNVMPNCYTRHPALTAMSAVTLDRMSGGRMRLLLNRSVGPWMEGLLGYDYRSPAKAMENYLHVLEKLIADEEVNFASKQFTLRNARLNMAPIRSHIPVLIGAMGPRTLEWATKEADGVVLNIYTSSTYAKWATQLIREKSSSTPFEIGCQIRISITDDAGAKIRSLKPEIAFLLSLPNFGELFLEKSGFETTILDPIREALKMPELLARNRDPAEAFEVGNVPKAISYLPDEVVEVFAAVGSVGKCRERLGEYSKAGVTFGSLFVDENEFEKVATHLHELFP